MHIPDGFLSTPVWAAADAAAIPTIVLAARQAQREMQGPDDRRAPLFGVMGAFVLAAQMINFPVAPGTSGHLVGGALLAIVLGPWPASMVMTAILVLQAFIFQDGGVLALGTNIVNMAFAGVFAGYFPYRLLGGNTARKAAIFLGGLLSVLLSAALALSELLISGVHVSRHLLTLSIGAFVLAGVLEGAITVAAVNTIERMNPLWVRQTNPLRGSAKLIYSAGAAVVFTALILIASDAPDAIQVLLPSGSPSPADAAVGAASLKRAGAGLGGMVLIFTVLSAISVVLGRRRDREGSA